MEFLSTAQVFHKRLIPRINEFSYRVFYLCFDISKISQLKKFSLSLNSFNLFSFYNKDYGLRDASNIEVWIRKILSEKNLNQKVTEIFLLTHPRILGYVFNPVSFWFCLDKDKNLICVLCEVNNTFGENHNYLIFNKDHSPIHANQEFEAKKEFHVSPFFTREGKYKFRFKFDLKNIFVAIDYLNDFDEKKLLTSISCKNEELTNINLIKAFFNFPFVTFKVIFLIHYQAVKILLKKIKYVPKPNKKSHNLTINDK
jgi:DUF1365 family protein